MWYAIVTNKPFSEKDYGIVKGCLSRLTGKDNLEMSHFCKVKDVAEAELNAFQAIGEYSHYTEELVSFYDTVNFHFDEELPGEVKEDKKYAIKALFIDALDFLIESGNPEDIVYYYKD